MVQNGSRAVAAEDGLDLVTVHPIADPDPDAAIPEGLAAAVDLPDIEGGDGVVERHLARLNLAVAVHFSIHKHLGPIEDALAPGGWLIYETFGGQGMNWIDLPKAGQLQRKLAPQFEFLALDERPVGPKEERSVVARLFARKRR